MQCMAAARQGKVGMGAACVTNRVIEQGGVGICAIFSSQAARSMQRDLEIICVFLKPKFRLLDTVYSILPGL